MSFFRHLHLAAKMSKTGFFAGTYRQLSKMTNCHCVHFFDRKMSANMFDKLKSSFMLASRAFSFYETLKCTCHFTFCWKMYFKKLIQIHFSSLNLRQTWKWNSSTEQYHRFYILRYWLSQTVSQPNSNPHQTTMASHF